MWLALRSVRRSYELVVNGAVSRSFVDALDGFEVADTVDGGAQKAGRVDGRGRLYHALPVVASDIDLVAVRPVTDGWRRGPARGTHHDRRGG